MNWFWQKYLGYITRVFNPIYISLSISMIPRYTSLSPWEIVHTLTITQSFEYTLNISMESRSGT